MDTINNFVINCEHIFQDNLLCILLVGSAQRDDINPFSDIDIIMIIKTMNINQVAQLRLIIRSSNRLIDCSILCQDELSDDPNDFCLGSHGCYQLELVLKQAKCVWGENILLSMTSPTEHNIKVSIARKVIEYTWWIRRMFIESNRERSIEMNYKFNSRLIKMIRDVLYLHGNTGIIVNSVENILDEFFKEYTEMFTKAEQLVLVSLGDVEHININTSNMSDEYLLIRYSIANKIHNEITKMIKSGNL